MRLAKAVRFKSSGFKSLLCYLLCFSLPVLWLLMGIRLIYPYRLFGTAPVFSLPYVLPLKNTFSLLFSKVLPERDCIWLIIVFFLETVAWFITLLLQLLWRFSARKIWNPAKSLHRTIQRMRLMLLAVFAVNLVCGFLLWYTGISLIMNKTVWDYLCYFPALTLNISASVIVSRLASPAVISGKNAYYIRL